MPFAVSHGTRIHFTQAGTGPAVFFLQGVGAIGRAWQPQLKALTSHTVVAFDNRGIGKSPHGPTPLSIEGMAADAVAVADAAGAALFDVVGHSMGGVIAQEVALSVRSRVRSLSLLCTFARGAQGARLSWDLLVAGLRSRLGPRSARRRAFVELVMTREFLAQMDRDALDLLQHDPKAAIDDDAVERRPRIDGPASVGPTVRPHQWCVLCLAHVAEVLGVDK